MYERVSFPTISIPEPKTKSKRRVQPTRPLLVRKAWIRRVQIRLIEKGHGISLQTFAGHRNHPVERGLARPARLARGGSHLRPAEEVRPQVHDPMARQKAHRLPEDRGGELGIIPTLDETGIDRWKGRPRKTEVQLFW